MGWKQRIGSFVDFTRHRILASRGFPLTRRFPHGVSWPYDAQRFANRRHFGTIIDAGANVGQTARTLLLYFPDAAIYCFEPVSSTFDKLAASVRPHRNIICVNAALGQEDGSAPIALHADSELNTLVLNGQRPATGDVETVDVMALDSFTQQHGIASIDVLKMDVQGWEANVIAGAARTLNQTRFIVSEVGFRREDRDLQNFGDFNDLMERSGFVLCGLYGFFRYGDRKQFCGFADALYINRKTT